MFKIERLFLMDSKKIVKMCAGKIRKFYEFGIWGRTNPSLSNIMKYIPEKHIFSP
jgi:hypothetical protein